MPAGSTPGGRAAADAVADEAGAVLHGVGVAPGIAVGPAYVYMRESVAVRERRVAASDDELARFEKAVRRAERDLDKLAHLTREKLGEESAGVFEAQQLMLRDEALYDAVVEHIRTRQRNADYAVRHVMAQHQRRLQGSENAYLRERVQDLEDVQERVIRHLHRGKMVSTITPGTVVVAERLTAADLILFAHRDILGCVMAEGASTSHVAIMARALGLPAVVGVPGVTEEAEDGVPVALDGWRGDVVLGPSAQQRHIFEERRSRYEHLRDEHQHLRALPAETTDGRRLTLHANLELPQELDLLEKHGAEGVGLFRTEMLILRRGQVSMSEEFNARVYREVIEAVRPHVTTLRLLDLGGDKLLPRAHREHNPFLGWRGIRILLDRPHVLRAQLRAALQASAHGPMRLLLPMVSQLDEVHRFREVLAEVQRELREAGTPFDAGVPVGIMVEVPAVALRAETFAPHVDFFSIGTNDLTQFMLAVDRSNSAVAGRYSELHPAVLRLIRDVAATGEAHGVPVSLCGEMASRVQALPLLVGLGVRTLSASPTYLPEMKRVVRSLCYEEARALGEEALAQCSAQAVRRLVEAWLRTHAPETLQPYDALADA